MNFKLCLSVLALFGAMTGEFLILAVMRNGGILPASFRLMPN